MQGLGAVGDGPGVVFFLRPGQAAVAVGIHITGVDGDGLIEIGNRVIEFTGEQTGQSPVVVGFGRTGIDGDGSAAVVDGAAVVAAVDPGEAPVVEGFEIIGHRLDGHGKLVDGGLVVFGLERRQPLFEPVLGRRGRGCHDQEGAQQNCQAKQMSETMASVHFLSACLHGLHPCFALASFYSIRKIILQKLGQHNPSAGAGDGPI